MTNRPGQEITYTSNWPHEPLVGNRPTTGTLMWSCNGSLLGADAHWARSGISALEVVPLLVVGFEAYTRYKVEHEAEWQRTYRWPFLFFTARGGVRADDGRG